ncbi:MAG: hypothetical protein ILM98_15705 [Kiritimatiellae bacterium]|nr:hypothetical protein [Kiritimatiellia bacterium]
MAVLLNFISVIASGLISFVIARHVKPHAKLSITLDRHMELSKKLLGGSFSFKKDGKTLTNVMVLKLSIATGLFSGVGKDNFHSHYKPCIKIKGFNIVGFNTLNNDRTRFDIPLGLREKDNTIILNINWIQRNSMADFIVVGHIPHGYHENDVEATLFPGLCRDVTVSHSGSLIRGIDRMNFESENLEDLHDFR